MPEGTVVTFYSYKGGVGRTLALANIGALLTRWGFKVLCVDWDLEAPGLHLYFERWVHSDSTSEQTLRSGLTELIHDYVDGKQPKWTDFLTEVRFPHAVQPMKLMTAGKLDKSYVERMQGLDWKDLYEKHELGNFLEKLRSEWKEAFDFVFIDSRTGITDIGGICTVQLPDLMVLLFTANLQSLRGSLDVVTRAKEARKSLPFDRAKLLVLPVATRFEMRVEYQLAQEWLKTFANELREIYAEWTHKDVTAEELLNHTRVPYLPFWSFGEKLPVIEKGTDDPDDIGFSFETLAALVAQRFSYSDVLATNRDSFVAAARRAQPLNGGIRKRSGKSGKAIKVFISYSGKDEAYLHQLETHLKPIERQGLIEIWDYYQNAPGESWHYEVERNMDEADVVLLLISADFLALDFMYDIEMRRILQLHQSGQIVVIPVLLRPVSWKGSPIENLQMLPEGGKPVATWPNADEPLAQIAQKIQELAVTLTRSKSHSQ
ncbi:MAG: TIR domain-containing protein [Acidobacteriota bacterium]|nr:TIR domain-containing protein [Acidobacteriota bacterium]